jgi:hypothetical protein
MTLSVITTSRSTLMHASLAYLSPEFQTLDSIVLRNSLGTSAPHSSPNLLSLPLEILLLIRSHLLPIIINHLIALSTSSLLEYESSLRSLLCPECILYNQDIFGPDIWQWEQFSGPCACADIKSGIENSRKLISRRTSRLASQINPKHFTDPQHWLESHLSRESLRLRVLQRSSPVPPTAIWDIVSYVLREFGCEVLRANARVMNHGRFMSIGSMGGSSRGLLSRWRYRRNDVLVVPLASAIRRCEKERIGQSGIKGDRWRKQIILSRVERDLGLSFDYENEATVIQKPIDRATPPISQPRISSLIDPTSKRARSSTPLLDVTFLTLLINVIQTVTAIVVACASLPLTFATFFVAVLCYYSRPGALRIL